MRAPHAIAMLAATMMIVRVDQDQCDPPPLQNGKSYRFQVAATNAVGTGAATATNKYGTSIRSKPSAAVKV